MAGGKRTHHCGSCRPTRTIEAVLSTLEIADAKAREDANGSASHAGFATAMLHLTKPLADLVPTAGEAVALGA